MKYGSIFCKVSFSKCFYFLQIFATAVLLAVATNVASRPSYQKPVFPPKFITIVEESRSYPDNGRHSAYFKASNGIEFKVSGKEGYEGGAILEGEYRY